MRHPPTPPQVATLSLSLSLSLSGQGERLGKHWPRTKVPVLPSPPPSFSDFESDHLAPGRPVVLEGLLEEMRRASGFDLAGEERGAASGRAAISSVMAQFVGRPDIRCCLFFFFFFHFSNFICLIFPTLFA